jgi:hypothetical protein
MLYHWAISLTPKVIVIEYYCEVALAHPWIIFMLVGMRRNVFYSATVAGISDFTDKTGYKHYY